MSNQYIPKEQNFARLQDKVVVITGGATGIGAATVRLLNSLGAYVVFGDINEPASQRLIADLDDPPRATFVRTDVSSYADTVNLFRKAWEKHGTIHHALQCAGILEQPGWFDDTVSIDEVENREPPAAIFDVNVRGTAYFIHAARVFLKHGKSADENRSITVTSSIAGYRQSPQLPTYCVISPIPSTIEVCRANTRQSAKHAILGLMRSVRDSFYTLDRLRVNAICPGMTETPMTTDIVKVFRSNGLPVNSATDCARIAIALQSEERVFGKSLFIAGGRAWEVEESLEATMPLWLGEQPTKEMRDGLKILSQVSCAVEG
jgi:NAD(P)-dependent dehydrogenase (short-subunit alcohol dehydrogenase family)